MAKVTVIMPSLNVVKYIRPCMESVLSQTLQDIEILSIDAGSTDGTLEILEEYAGRDNRIHIIHSDKRSYGYQLNMGISMASGEYVGVVETDDVIIPEMYEKLYSEAINTDADYVKGAVQLFMEVSPGLCFREPVWHVFKDGDVERMMIWPKYMPELFLKDNFLWTGIYRRDFIRQIKLNETSGAAYQDAGFMLQAYGKAESAVYIRDLCYLYRQDNMGASGYDRRAFRYFVQEYDYMLQFLPDMSEKWREIYYVRMLKHCRRKFLIMGVSGEFWEEALSDMENLQSRLQYAWQHGILNEKNLDAALSEDLQLFLKGPRAIYESYVSIYRHKVGHITEMMEKTTGRDIVIFGGGKRGRFLHMLMEYKHPGAVKVYCDNQEKLWGTEIQGRMVVAPKEAHKRYPDAMYLIAGRRDDVEMRTQLRQLGVVENRVFTYTEKEEMMLFQIIRDSS